MSDDGAVLRERAAARLLVLDPDDRLLLFRFVHRRGALQGQTYWATPGGGVEPGETTAEAAIRELREEAGIVLDAVGDAVGHRAFRLQLPSGEIVRARETFYLVRVGRSEVSRAGWTALETEIMAEHRWWTVAELAATADTVFPVTLMTMLAAAGVGPIA